MNDASQRPPSDYVPRARDSGEQLTIHTAGPVRDGGAMGRRRRAAQSTGGAEYRSKRREVIHAAATVFAVKGYQATNLDDIATALETNRASLYYYVSGKEELLREAIAEYGPGFVEDARRIASGRQTTAEKLRSFVNWIMESYESDYPHRYLLLLRNDAPREDTQWADQIDEVGRQIQVQLIEILRQGIESGELRANLPVDLVANAVFGMLNWADRWFKPGPGHPAEEVADCFVELLLDGLTEPHASGHTSV